MNNLQLFRMYRRFRDREIASFRWLMNAPDDAIVKLWNDWRKWEGLARRVYTELEKRLALPADDSLRRQNDAVRFCARLGLFTPD